MPFWLIESHFIVAWGSVNNLEPELFLVDTGLAGKGFTASETVLRKAGIAFNWNMAKEGPVGGGSARVVGIVLRRVALGAAGEETGYRYYTIDQLIRLHKIIALRQVTADGVSHLRNLVRIT